MRHVRPLGSLALVGIMGCACGGTADRVPQQQPVATQTTAAAYDVHEWGVLRAAAGDVLEAGAVAPPMVRAPIAIEKPVLYFHADAPTTLRTIDVDAHGQIIEAWPPSAETLSAPRIRWTDVMVDPTRACSPSALPSPTDPACAAVPSGTTCETPQLARVRASGASCIETHGTTDTLLFYRARSSAFTPPLTFERTSAYEDVAVTNTGELPIPGWLVRIRDHYGSVITLAVRPPGPHESIVVGHDFAATTVETPPVAEETPPPPNGSATPGRDAIRSTMHELGMTDPEVDAFLRAWDDPLFALGAAEGEDATERTPPPSESFLYFLPEARCSEVASVTFDPPPRAFRRAFAVWSPIPASGVSH